MAREEEKRSELSKEQVAKKEALSKARAEENEKVQRQQWSGSVPNDIPVPMKARASNAFENENEQRKKFLQDVEQASQTGGGQQQQKSNIK